jgi:hypothetical protein
MWWYVAIVALSAVWGARIYRRELRERRRRRHPKYRQRWRVEE